MKLVLDFVLLAISIFLFAVTLTFNVVNIESGGGGAFWPQILLILIIGLEIVNIIITYRKIKKGEEVSVRDPEITQPINLYIAIGALFAYILLMDYLGFLISTTIFMFFLMYILKVKLKRNLIVSFLAGYGISFVFVVLLMVPLPQGVSFFRTVSILAGV